MMQVTRSNVFGQVRRPPASARISVRVKATDALPAPQAEVYDRLRGVRITHALDGQQKELLSQWGGNDTTVVAFARHLGWPFCMELAVQLRRDWKPQLDGLGIKLVLVSIGTYEKSLEFAKTTGFPTANLFVDPEVASYTALGMYKGVGATFFNAETPKAILQRMKEGKMQDIKDMVKDWSPSAPPITNSVLQQGGMFVFEGDRCTFAHYDKATGAHLAMDTVLAEVNKLAVARGGAGRATPR